MKKQRFWILVVAVLLGVAFIGYYGYVSTRQARLLKQARGYLAKSNAKTALVCLRRALGYNPNDVEACRLMAELAESASSPAAMLWRSRVVELTPKSTPDRISLAQTAMMFGDYLSATNALEGISKTGKNTAAYHNAAGSVALAGRYFAEAEAHFLEACQMEPTNPAPRMNLAIVRLQSTNTYALVQARAALGALRSNPVLRCQALRESTLDAMRHQQGEVALAFAAELIRETNHVFSDELLRLDVLRANRENEFKPALAALQGDAAKDSRKIYELVMWQSATAGPAEALNWLQTLPVETQTNQPAALLAAECRSALRDWPGLQASLQRQNWAELELIRHAFQSLSLRGQNLVSSSTIEWQMALNAAGNRKEALVMLFRLATAWNWAGQKEDLLWALIRNYPTEKWATVSLSKSLLVEGRTRSLMALYNQQVNANPSDLSARNNLAMTALLLGAWELRPHDLAREVFRRAPANPAYASTYAFSLHIQKKDDNALKVLEKLTPQQLEDPAVAGYYGVVLRATGKVERAQKYLRLAANARLLPEERKLVEEATAGTQIASSARILAEQKSF
jgi:Flp pilus assembly protein TadD